MRARVPGAREIVVIRTGVANMASVAAAFGRLGLPVRVAEEADDVARAEAVLLPGVGAFAAGMAALQEQGLVTALTERLRARRPTLAVCLGMHLLCRGSEEAAPHGAGIGYFDAIVQRFPAGQRVPQMGWNAVRPGASCKIVSAGFAYFANSYRVVRPPAPAEHDSTGAWDSMGPRDSIGPRCAFADHGGEFVAAIEDGPIVACQFHPELSGAWGRALLERWCERAFAGAGTEASSC